MKVKYDLDVLKPHLPSNDSLARTLAAIKGVTAVKIKVDEIDQKTTSIFIKIEGNEGLSLESVTQTLEEMNCSLHSVDNVEIANDE